MEKEQSAKDFAAIDLATKEHTFSFLKGAEDVVVPKEGEPFSGKQAAVRVREQLSDAMNARNVTFLLGSGCSSVVVDNKELGVPTMAPMAKRFLEVPGPPDSKDYITEIERTTLAQQLGINIVEKGYIRNLERLLEVLFSLQFGLKACEVESLKEAKATIESVIDKTTRYVLRTCTDGAFTKDDETVLGIYQAFYRKLAYRDRSLPRPWVFTTNYDLFNESAMDRLSVPYCNGFLGTVERRFNPATFRYALAEQLDISSRKWTAVDNFVYLCKLHGSVNWIEEPKGLFPIREQQQASASASRVVIYPTPTKQNASFSSPYVDLFREFQRQIVQDQSVLFVIGYSFGDEHINNIIFQALTVPTFRLVAFVSPDQQGVVSQLRELRDPRVWLIGGNGPDDGSKAHYFNTFVEKFMPQLPSDKIDAAVEKVIQKLVGSAVRNNSDGS